MALPFRQRPLPAALRLLMDYVSCISSWRLLFMRQKAQVHIAIDTSADEHLAKIVAL